MQAHPASLRNVLRAREPFPTRFTNLLEIGIPIIGLLLLMIGIVLFFWAVESFCAGPSGLKSSIAQSYARLGLDRQARDLGRLGNLAPSNLYKNGNLVVRDAGRFSGTASQLQAIRLRAMMCLRTPFTDVRAANVGSNGLVFDPSLNPIAHATTGPPKMRIAFLCGFSINHHVILKEPWRLKDLRYSRLRLAVTEILRCAQDDLRNKYVLISNA